MQDLETLIKQRLAKPVKNSSGATLLNDEGQPLTALDAMVMSVVNNAMKGDIASLLFVQNITRSRTADDEYFSQQQKLLKEKKEYIKTQLDAEGLYINQDEEIERVAGTLLVCTRLERLMMESDNQDIVSEFKKDGTSTVKISPLNEIRDKYVRMYSEQLNELKTNALRSVLNIKNKKIKKL